MKNKKTIIHVLVIILALSPIAYLMMVWPSLTDPIKTRIYLEQLTIKEQSKRALLMATVVLAVCSVIIFLLLTNLRRIDPKVKKSTPDSGFNRIAFSITIFLIVLNYFSILTAAKSWQVSQKSIFFFAGLLFAVLGNYLNNVRPNFFVGIRLPWTLNDDNNWRKTHRLAGRIFFYGGLVFSIVCWLLPDSALKPVFITFVITMALIPCVYSYSLFKNKR